MRFNKKGSMFGVLILTFIFFVLLANAGFVSANDVQRGVEVMDSPILNVTINEVNPSKSIVLLSTKSSRSSPGDLQITGTLVNETLLQFEKFGSEETVVSWEVIENSDFNVQRGQIETSSSSTNSIHIDINEINLNKSFILISNRLNATENNQNVRGFWTTEFINETGFNLTRDVVGNVSTVSWQVVYWEGANIQRGFTPLHSGSSNATLGINEVDLDKSFIYAMKRSTVTAARNTLIRSYFINETNIGLQRELDEGITTLSWFVISHPDISVQKGIHSFTGDSPQNIEISEINLSKSSTLQSNSFSTRNTFYGQSFLTSTLTNETNLQLQKGISNNIVNSSWFVIEFIKPLIITPDEISLEFINNPAKFFTLNITENNETNFSTSGFESASKFFNITSDELKNEDFNVTLTFDYDSSGVSDEDELDVYFFNETDDSWQLVPNPTINKTEKTISVTVNHFTIFSVFEKESSQSSQTTSSSSGGGGGFCVTEWECDEWSVCNKNGKQTRTCSYPEGWCEPREEKPDEVQDCVVEKQVEEEVVEEVENSFLDRITGAVVGTLIKTNGGAITATFVLLIVLLTILVVNDSNNKNQKKKNKSSKTSKS
ncbi:MAG: hypothetical protein WDZ69_01150 [Candidatus Pacearchaeota archaeon]